MGNNCACSREQAMNVYNEGKIKGLLKIKEMQLRSKGYLFYNPKDTSLMAPLSNLEM